MEIKEKDYTILFDKKVSKFDTVLMRAVLNYLDISITAKKSNLALKLLTDTTGDLLTILHFPKLEKALEEEDE